jgi:hypothetical protein
VTTVLLVRRDSSRTARTRPRKSTSDSDPRVWPWFRRSSTCSVTRREAGRSGTRQWLGFGRFRRRGGRARGAPPCHQLQPHQRLFPGRSGPGDHGFDRRHAVSPSTFRRWEFRSCRAAVSARSTRPTHRQWWW